MWTSLRIRKIWNIAIGPKSEQPRPTVIRVNSSADSPKPIRALNLTMRHASPTSHNVPVVRLWWIRIVYTLCLVPSVVWAISPSESSVASSYLRTDFTIDDGLPDNVISAITQTQNGLLWVASGDHLASFDGRTFTPVQLRIPGVRSTGAVSSLVAGRDGDLWVGTYSGIIRIPKRDLNDPDLTELTAFRLGKRQDAEVFVLFAARDGTIWAGTNDGLYKFDGSQFLCAFSSELVSRISQTSNGQLILITSHGVAEFDGKNLVRSPGLGVLLGVHDDEIFDAYQDSHRTMWYATVRGIRSVMGHRVASLNPRDPAHAKTYRIFAGLNDTLWMSTSIGIYRIAGGNMWSPAPNLESRGFYAGRDGDLWIGTNGSGLVHLKPRTVQMYTKAEGLPSNIPMAVLPDHDGRLWVGMNCGLGVLEGGHFRTINEKDGLANTCVWSLAEDRSHNIWLGTYGGGLFRFKDGIFTQYSEKEGLSSGAVTRIVVAKDDSLWVTTPHGLSHFQEGKIRNYTASDGLSSSSVLDVFQDGSGNIWVATGGGVDRFVSGRFVPLPVTKDASGVLARRFFEDSGNGLYTSDLPEGISQIRNGQLAMFNRELSVMEMTETPDHKMWFSSEKGVIGFGKGGFARAGNAGSPLDYEVFTRADGLNTTETSGGNPNITMTSDGKLWIATVRGLAMIDTLRLPRIGERTPIFIAGVSVDGKSHFVGNGLILPPGVHHVELRLAAVDLANSQRLRLRYRMQDVDPGWLDASSSRIAVYTSFPVGTHRLLIRATDSIGHWDEPEIVYEVTQKPHFYERLLFRTSTIIAIVLLLILAYFWRVRYLIRQSRRILEERQVEREALAGDLHDTFLQGIQGLVLSFHTGTQKLPQDHPVRKSFEESLKHSDRVMLEGRNLLSRLHVRRIRPESLTDTFAAVGKEFRYLGPAQFEVIVNGHSRELNTLAQEELAKIGREALFNAFRHARAGRIEVEIHFGILELRLRFRDDGIGVDPAILRDGSVAGHYGLPSMRERASRIRARLELWSRPGAGSEIEVRIPGTIAYSHNRESRIYRWIRHLLRSREL
jgi:ligand-binding sensor domain-containing protein/signal transduction histidine kinase